MPQDSMWQIILDILQNGSRTKHGPKSFEALFSSPVQYWNLKSFHI
jgi:hypothetical protein